MKKADFILVGIILAAAGVLLFVLYGLNGNSGEYVQIEVDSQVVEVLPLDKD